MSRFVDFKAVKAAVSLLQVLERYGIAGKFKQTGDSLSGPCPLHEGHNPTQFRVSISKNCWHCFGRCNEGGNVLDFVAKKESVSLRDAALMLTDWFHLPEPTKASGEETIAQAVKKETPSRAAAKNKPERIDESVPNKPLGFELQHLDQQHPYLTERRISSECVEHFGVGYCAKGSMTGRIVFPIHNVKGELVAYAGRWPGDPPDDETPKYKQPPGFRKMRELYNAHRAFAEPDDSPLVIVEGFFDALSLWQHGIRRVVALMGSALSDVQEELIASATNARSHILLMLDEDEAGREARKQIAPRLAQHCYVRVLRFDREDQQPDSLTAEQVASLIV